jgi:hypothetical protein
MTTKTPSIPDPKTISRRGFLYYVWGASAALLGAEAVGVGVWFSTPRSENTAFEINPHTLPLPGSEPIAFPKGKLWWVNTHTGLLALSMICSDTRRGPHLFKWTYVYDQFFCPVCGSRYMRDGTVVAETSVVRRNLDKFVVWARRGLSVIRTPQDGSPLDIYNANAIFVDTRFKILGKQEVG